MGGDHFTSTDGLGWIRQAPLSTEADDQIVLSNPIPEVNPPRLMGFHLGLGELRSYTTTDGNALTLADEVHLALDATCGLESSWIKDPAIVKLADGSWLMVYVTEIAE